jgi:ABC-type transport system involved in cytochrome c biogenesis permease subunit
MAETVIYVPWIAMFSGIVLAKIFSLPAIRYASSLTAAILLTILEMTLSAGNLSTIQPVLNSQYWLIIHVLMVVGSYGFFVLAGILGHLFLINCFFVKKNPEKSSRLIAALLQCLYIGTFLLIAGTILGGVWAAESWGRFWDWDPKEAWAFISACGYLMIIHAYRFRHIADFGLAIGSILGLLTISFTWYGVNYILGTGLHSYGFGSGGEIYYYAFLFAEILFVAASGIVISKLGIKGS